VVARIETFARIVVLYRMKVWKNKKKKSKSEKIKGQKNCSS